MSINPKILLLEGLVDKEEYNKKRKRAEKSFKETTKVVLPEEDVDPSCLTLQVQSTDKTKQYPVKVKYDVNGISYECSCGDQFGMKQKRNNCKHVATAVLEMNKAFLDSHVVEGKMKTINQDTISEIVALLEKFQLD